MRSSLCEGWAVCAPVLLAMATSGCTTSALVSNKPDEDELRAVYSTVQKPILPTIHESSLLLPGETLKETVADALARMGPDAVPGLVEALRSPDDEVRAGAARALALMGPPDAERAVPDLIAALDDSSLIVRRYAVRAIARLGPAAKEATPRLLKMLNEPSNSSFVAP